MCVITTYCSACFIHNDVNQTQLEKAPFIWSGVSSCLAVMAASRRPRFGALPARARSDFGQVCPRRAPGIRQSLRVMYVASNFNVGPIACANQQPRALAV